MSQFSLDLDDDPELGAAGQVGIEGQDEVALLRPARVARIRAGSLEQVVGAAGDLAQHRVKPLLIGHQRGEVSVGGVVALHPTLVHVITDLAGDKIGGDEGRCGEHGEYNQLGLATDDTDGHGLESNIRVHP